MMTKEKIFKLDDFVEPGTFILNKNSYRALNLSFLDFLDDFDFVTNAIIKIVTTTNISGTRKIRLFYFDVNHEKVYVDFGNALTVNSTKYIVFNISSFVSTKKHINTSLYIENTYTSNITLSKNEVNILEIEYIHHNQLFGNKSLLRKQIEEYEYNYNYISGEFFLSRRLYNNLLRFDFNLIYNNKAFVLEHLFFKKGWNINLLEYLVFENNIPVAYVDRNNYLHELKLLIGANGEYYTNDGSGLVLKLVTIDNINYYKLFSELISGCKLFDTSSGNIVRSTNLKNESLYFYYYQNQIVIRDNVNNYNEIIINKINELQISICLNSSIYYTIYLSDNNIIQIVFDNKYDTFVYQNDSLTTISLYSEYVLELIRNNGSFYLTEINHKYQSNYLEKYKFEYDYLATYITNLHQIKTLYSFDINMELVSTCEVLGNEQECFFCSDKKMLTKDIAASVLASKSRKGSFLFSADSRGLNMSSNNAETALCSFDSSFKLKSGHSYIIMATLEKNSNVVLNETRVARLNLYKSNGTTKIATLEFNPVLKKQTAVISFKCDFNENNSVIAKAYAKNMNYFGGVIFSNIRLLEPYGDITSFLVKDSIGFVFNDDEEQESIGAFDWHHFSTGEDVYENDTRYYSYKDLIRNYINLKRNLPYYWSSDNKKMEYRFMNSSTLGFPLRKKVLLPSTDTVIGKKSIKKYYVDNNEIKEIFEFEYLEANVPNEENSIHFFFHKIMHVGSMEYEVVNEYDSELRLIKCIDNFYGNQTDYDYLNENVTKIIKSNGGYSPFMEERYVYDSLNRLTASSRFVEQSFETVQKQYLSNYMIVNKTIDEGNREVTFDFDSRLSKNISVSSNNIYLTKEYNNDCLSKIINETEFSFQKGNFGQIETLHISPGYFQNKIIEIGVENKARKIFYNSNTSYETNYNKYGNIKSIVERPLGSYETTNRATFLYFKTRPNNIETINTQTGDISGDCKLYKIIDFYADNEVYYDYSIDNKLTDVKCKYHSALLYSVSYTYDYLDRLVNCKLIFSTSSYIDVSYSFTYSIVDEIQGVEFNVVGLLNIGNHISENSTHDNLRRITSLYISNSETNANGYKQKYELEYLNKTLDNKLFTNNLVRKINYYKPNLHTEFVGGEPLYSISYAYYYSDYFSYTPTSNIASIAHGDINSPTNNTGVAYSYDALDQLTQEINYDLGKQINYSYDNNGNILSIVETDLSTNTTATLNYRYDSTYKDKLIAINDNIHENILYDEDLNITQIGNTYLDWTRGRLLESISKVIGTTNNGIDIHLTDEFIYNYEGIRTEKIDSLGEHNYLLEGHKILGEKITLDNQTIDVAYLYGQNGIFGFIYDGHMYYYQKNILGDITHIYDGTNLVCRYVYDAYGNHKVFDSNNNDITDNDPSTNIGLINPFRYRGYYYDIDFGLYYCNSRYYSPYLRRWINIDEFDYINPDDILGLNLFAYCKNNPIRYTDEEGNLIFDILLPALLFNLVSNTALQFTVSSLTYLGLCIAAAFDPKIKNDMDRIGWNPFNSDAEKVLGSSVVSFYKGVPVINKGVSDRSGSFLFIFLNEKDVNNLRHEFGHVFQQLVLGPINYFAYVFIPSALQMDVNEDGSNYYYRPWEIFASFLGKDKRYHYSDWSIAVSISHTLIACFFGPVSYFFTFWG